MIERIEKRIAELEQAERDTVMQLTVIRNLLIELRALLAPDAPAMSGDPLDVDMHDAAEQAFT